MPAQRGIEQQEEEVMDAAPDPSLSSENIAIGEYSHNRNLYFFGSKFHSLMSEGDPSFRYIWTRFKKVLLFQNRIRHTPSEISNAAPVSQTPNTPRDVWSVNSAVYNEEERSNVSTNCVVVAVAATHDTTEEDMVSEDEKALPWKSHDALNLECHREPEALLPTDGHQSEKSVRSDRRFSSRRYVFPFGVRSAIHSINCNDDAPAIPVGSLRWPTYLQRPRLLPSPFPRSVITVYKQEEIPDV